MNTKFIQEEEIMKDTTLVSYKYLAEIQDLGIWYAIPRLDTVLIKTEDKPLLDKKLSLKKYEVIVRVYSLSTLEIEVDPTNEADIWALEEKPVLPPNTIVLNNRILKYEVKSVRRITK